MATRRPVLGAGLSDAGAGLTGASFLPALNAQEATTAFASYGYGPPSTPAGARTSTAAACPATGPWA